MDDYNRSQNASGDSTNKAETSPRRAGDLTHLLPNDDDDDDDLGNIDKIESMHVFSADQIENNSSINNAAIIERAQQQKDAILKFSELVKTLPEKSLSSLFQAGVNFWKGLTTSRGSGGGLNEELKSKLATLLKKLRTSSDGVNAPNRPFPALEGFDKDRDETRDTTADAIDNPLNGSTNAVAIPSESAAEGADQSSTAASDVELSELSVEDARREFLCTLFAAFPYWKYDNFL
eukprot:gene23194-30064_t